MLLCFTYDISSTKEALKKGFEISLLNVPKNKYMVHVYVYNILL